MEATSASLARILIKRGYDRISVLYGGFDAWTRKGYPTQPATKGETALGGALRAGGGAQSA